jgi:hypothetical protein
LQTMDIVKLLLERLLSWPVITLSVFLVFRKPLIALLQRVNTLKAGKEGFSLDATVTAVAIQREPKVETGLKSNEAEERLKMVKRAVIPPSVQQREEWIRADLKKMNLDETRCETVDLLIQHLALMQATASAERIYRTIFGSQIALLKVLNTHVVTPRAGAEVVYEVAKSKFPELYNTYSFQQWLNYLISNGLITATTEPEQFSITVDGREFLKWMTDAAVMEDKPF